MQPRLAILIDTENVPARHWPQLRKTIEAMGQVLTCRLFGNFSNSQRAKWLTIAQAEALQTVMQLSGPNASDIAITISAMDLLNTGKFEAFCLVSSDHDYTPLAHRLRSAGVKVHGFGEAKALPSFRMACTTFTELPAKLKTQPVAVAKAA